MAQVDANVRSLKWKLWHGQTDRALDQLETMKNECAKLRREAIFQRHACSIWRTPCDLCPFKQERDYQLRSPLSIRPAHRYGVGRVRREFPGRPTDGQKAADAMVKAGRPSSASGSGRRSQRRSSASASRTNRRNKPIDRGSRGCSSRHRRCSRRPNTPANLSVPNGSA